MYVQQIVYKIVAAKRILAQLQQQEPVTYLIYSQIWNYAK